jgi:hypothetical protein
MSDETQIFQMPYNNYLKVRLEFVLLRDDDLQARIMRIVESWMIEQKRSWEIVVAEAASQSTPEPPEPEYWVTLSYAQIIAQLYMFNSSRGSGKKDKPNGKEVIEGKNNKITRVTIANAIHALIEDNYLFVRSNPNQSKEYDASQYRLNIPLIQEHLKHLPKNPMSYLGSNGRINGIPCKDFLHPPLELENELGIDPRKKILHPHVNEINMGCKSDLHGDVKKSDHLIDKVIEPNKITNREDTTHVSNDNALLPPSSVSHSLSDEELIALVRERGLTVTPKEPQSEQQSNTMDEPRIANNNAEETAAEDKKGIKNKSGKATMTDRVGAAYDCYQQLCREFFANPTYLVHRCKSGSEEYNAVRDAIRDHQMSPEGMRMAFMEKWNKKDEDGTYWWRDIEHLTMRALCKGYGKTMTNILFKQKQAKEKNEQSLTGRANVTKIRQAEAAAKKVSPVQNPTPSESTTISQNSQRRFRLHRVSDLQPVSNQ